MAPRGRTRKHACNKCNESFSSGRALGGHMSRHWRRAEQPKRMPSPPANVVDVHVLLLSSSDEETLLPYSGTQCPLCSKVFSSCNSLREHMREHSEKKVLRKPVEEAAGLMEALAIADGGYSVVLSPSVKRKRSKRGPPALNFGVMDAAATLLLLSENSKKIPAYEDCCTEDMDSLSANVSKDVNLNAFNHLLVRSAEFKKPKGLKCSAYDNYYGQCEKDDNLNPNVPKKSADEDCYGQYENENILVYNVPKKDSNVTHNVSDKDTTLIPSVLKDNSPIPNVPKNSADEDCYGQYENENILVYNVPKKDSNVTHNVSDKDTTLIPNVLKDNTSIPNVPKNSADEDCYGQYENGNMLVYNVPKKDSNVTHNVSDKDTTLIPNVLKDNTSIPNVPKNSADEDCYGQYENENILVYNVPKKDSNVAHNVSDKDTTLIPNVLKDNTSIPNVPKNSAYEDWYGQYEEDNILFHNAPKDSNAIRNVPEKENTSIPNVPKEVELIVLDHVLVGDSKLKKRRTDYNSDEMKCGDLSAAVKVKRYDCHACRKSFGSGRALGGHMRCHCPRSNHPRQGFADRPESVVMDEQKQKPELDSKLPYLRLPALTDGHYILRGLKSEPEPWHVASRVY